MKLKQCSRCRKVKSIDKFYKRPDVKNPDSRMARCKDCHSTVMKNHRRKQIKKMKLTALAVDILGKMWNNHDNR